MSDEKTDFMNLTLYTLTLITALATPLIFLTGLFGMNFADMTELVLSLPIYNSSPRNGSSRNLHRAYCQT